MVCTPSGDTPKVGERVELFIPGLSPTRGTSAVVRWVDADNGCFGVAFGDRFVQHNLIQHVIDAPDDGLHLGRTRLRPGAQADEPGS